MSKCPNFENPDVLASFKEIDDATYPDFAWVVWDKNDGHNIDKAPNGEDSVLFNDLLEYFNGDRSKAIMYKSEIYSDLIYTSKDNLDENGEPPISRLNNFLPKRQGIENTKVKLVDFNQFSDYSDGVIAPGSKTILNWSGQKKVYNENFPAKSNRRFVANTFFRYNQNSKWSNRTEPHYPFRRSLSLNENVAFKNHINSFFNQPVVELNKDGIMTFLPKIEDAKRSSGGKDFVSNEPTEPTEILPNEVDVSHLETAIDRIYKKKLILEKRVRQGKENPEMKANISSMKKQIDQLEDEKKALVAPDILEDLASEDSKVISNNLDVIQSNLDNSDDLSGEQILNMLDSLVESSYTIKGWVDIQEVLQDVDVVSEDRLAKIAGTYSKLNIQYNSLLADLFATYANQETQFTDLSKDKVLEAVSDISDAKKLFFGLSDTGIPLLQVVDDVIKKAVYETNQESDIKKNQLEKEADKLKKAGYNQKEVSEIFKQLDSKGNWTGNIITEISHEYFVKKNELLDEAKKTGSWKKYYNWLHKNSVQLNAKQLQDIFKGDYSTALEDGFTKEQLDVQKSLIAEYEAEKSAYKDVVEFKYGDNLRAIEEDMNNWQRENSPLGYVQGDLNSVGYKYLIPERPDISKWADKSFGKIKNDKALIGFHNYLQKTFDENNKRIGYFNEFDEFYLPELESSLLERTKTQKALWRKASLLGNTLINSFTDEVENINENTVDIRGQIVKGVPIQMMNNRIAPALKEGNIFKVIESHTNMSLNYKYKTDIEPMTNAATDLLESIKEVVEVDVDGTKVAKRVRNFISKKEGKLFNAKKILEYAKDAYLYNQRKDVDARIRKVKTKELVVDEKTGEVTTKIVERDITGSSMADNLITYTYLKAMSIPNVVTPAVNMLFGTNANLIYASAGQDVTIKNMNKALLQMTSITARSFGGKTNHELSQKVFAFMSKFQILGAIHDTDYGKGVSPTEIATILQSKAEYFNQGALMLGALYTQKLKDKNGKEVSMIEAYKVENGALIWDVDTMGPESKVEAGYAISKDKKGVDLFRFGKHIDKVNAIVHGDYKSPMLAKKNSVGRLLMLFKTWLPQAVHHRFGAKEFNQNLIDSTGKVGRNIKGRYRSFAKMETLDGHDVLIADTIKMIIGGVVSRKAFNGLSEVDRVNMIRNMQEIKHIAAIYLMIALMKAALMDEDDDFKPGLNLAINTLTKTSADLSFFISPNSASQVLDNLVSVTSTLKDIERAIGAVSKTIQGDWEVKSGPQKGQTRIGVGMARTIPGFSGGMKMWNLGSKVVDY